MIRPQGRNSRGIEIRLDKYIATEFIDYRILKQHIRPKRFCSCASYAIGEGLEVGALKAKSVDMKRQRNLQSIIELRYWYELCADYNN
jgi:hypothetical protein